MIEIIALLQCVDQTLNKTALQQLIVMIPALLAMTGRVTMLGISRWTGEGGSYRTIQRFFNSEISWRQLNWGLLRRWVVQKGGEYFLLGDETVVTKAGKMTHGLDRFFSSIFGRPVPGLAFFSWDLANLEAGDSYPLLMEQLSKEESSNSQSRAKEKSAKTKPQKKQGKRGRPKGSKNKNRKQIELPLYLQNIEKMLKEVILLLDGTVAIAFCVLDGAFGNNNALQMVQQCGLHLISKLRSDSALYLPYEGSQKKCGQRRKYGDKLEYHQLPAAYEVETTLVDNIRTTIYQMTVWHKLFPDKLNVVVIVKVNLVTHQQARVILFSSDLALTWSKLIAAYRLRFQIEFNFRDAKQYWGLEDFMNVKQRPVYNAANLAMFMVNFSFILRQHLKEHHHLAEFSVLDLKAHFRGRRYAQEVLKFLPISADPLLIDHCFAKVGLLGAIHSPSS